MEVLDKLKVHGYEATIGLEIHVQLNTKTKIFSNDANESDGNPNTLVSSISLGLPGTLPKLNTEAIHKAIMMGIACSSKINERIHFDRKSYFYPDLPKGYQTTQDKAPICLGGNISLYGDDLLQEEVELHHIHLEEDAGKSVHDESHDTWIDLNRAGTPLIEMVTEPCIKGPNEAALCLQEIRRIVRYLDIGNANMEKGELRCDANISIKRIGDSVLGQKAEIKNMNSFSHVRKAIAYELERQLDLTVRGEEVVLETRTFDPNLGKTYGMRFKETMNDYRYFPCPDLPIVNISEEQVSGMDSMAAQTPQYFRNEFESYKELSLSDISVLTEEKSTALFFFNMSQSDLPKKLMANFVIGPIRTFLSEKNLEINVLDVNQLVDLLRMVNEGDLSHQSATKVILPLLPSFTGKVSDLVKEKNLFIEKNNALTEQWVNEVLLNLPKEVESFKSGKKQLFGLFMGEVMKKAKGKGNPAEIKEILMKKLK